MKKNKFTDNTYLYFIPKKIKKPIKSDKKTLLNRILNKIKK